MSGRRLAAVLTTDTCRAYVRTRLPAVPSVSMSAKMIRKEAGKHAEEGLYSHAHSTRLDENGDDRRQANINASETSFPLIIRALFAHDGGRNKIRALDLHSAPLRQRASVTQPKRKGHICIKFIHRATSASRFNSGSKGSNEHATCACPSFDGPHNSERFKATCCGCSLTWRSRFSFHLPPISDRRTDIMVLKRFND